MNEVCLCLILTSILRARGSGSLDEALLKENSGPAGNAVLSGDKDEERP